MVSRRCAALALLTLTAVAFQGADQRERILPGWLHRLGCVADATTAGLRCQQCLNNLVVNKANGKCMCPAGKYTKPASPNTCSDCPKGSYCVGADYSAASPPVAVACPGNMTTLGLRATSNRACVNLPGFYYIIDASSVGAVSCPVNTYSAGLKKQRACVPCPTGFTTAGRTGQTSPNACIVPAGYYLKAPGQVAPCPMGEWKSGVGTNASCTKCAFGVTTAQEGSTAESDCKILIAGYYAASVAANGAITSTKVCPQKFVCAGGLATAAYSGVITGNQGIAACPNGMWTIDIGSTSVDQCLTPPGFYTTGGVTAQCAAGSYRADWKAAGQATSCIACGEGIKADKTDQVTAYDPADYSVSKVSVTSSADDCYIEAGQGLYYNSLTATWRARDCDSNNYGVNNRTYGLTPSACRDCPSGQVASSNCTGFPVSCSYFVTNPSGTKGFISVKACVNKAGYGYDGRISQACDVGMYNAPDTYGTCSKCGYGLTTSGVAAGVYESDCGLAQGYGSVAGTIMPCPIGTYNGAAYAAVRTTACTACPTGTTTSKEGGDEAAACNLCLGGYGGDLCAATCGGTNGATYGPPGRALNSSCEACATQTTGYHFEWNLGDDLFQAAAIAKPSANSSTDCVAQFGQLQDGAWYLPLQSQKNVTKTTESNFAACAARCTENSPTGSPCQFATYDYVTSECSIRGSEYPTYIGEPLIAFKALPSGDVGTNAWKVKAHAISSGQYSFYQEPNALDVGDQSPAPGAAGFTTLQQCLNACDDDDKCAGITILMRVAISKRPSTCALIKGVFKLGKFVRTVTRADYTRFPLPDLLNGP